MPAEPQRVLNPRRMCASIGKKTIITYALAVVAFVGTAALSYGTGFSILLVINLISLGIIYHLIRRDIVRKRREQVEPPLRESDVGTPSPPEVATTDDLTGLRDRRERRGRHSLRAGIDRSRRQRALQSQAPGPQPHGRLQRPYHPLARFFRRSIVSRFSYD